MSNSNYKVPAPSNEIILNYTEGSIEKKEVLTEYKKMYNEKIKIPLYIGGNEVFTNKTKVISPPHDHNHSIGVYHICDELHVNNGILGPPFSLKLLN